MKKALSIVLSLMLLLAVVPVGTISTGALEDEVIEIRTIAELYNINNNMSGNYKLMNDIDMTEDTAVGGDWDFMGNGWEPIGSEGIYSNTPFTGTFDGDGHKIIGMRINRNTTPSGSGTIYLGLFANNAGTINNLGIDETSSIGSGSYSGGICANNSGTISNCYNKATISLGNCSGGICGYNSGDISECYNEADISSYQYSGGICGNSYCGDFYKCYNTGNISSSGSSTAYSGGICGNSSNIISNCFNNGKITSQAISSEHKSGKYSGIYVTTYAYCGGICGVSNKEIEKCFNKGELVSYASSRAEHGITSEKVYNHLDGSIVVSSYSFAGGICGIANESINNCYNIANITSTVYAKALRHKINNNYGSYTVSSETDELSTTTENNNGGIAGESARGINSCYNIGKATYGIKGTGTGAISNCYYLSTAGNSNTGAKALTSAQLKLEMCMPKFDFENTWVIYHTTEYNYPQLRCNLQDEPLMIGDANGDGIIDITDATCIQKHLAEYENDDYIEEASDTNKDGKISIRDVTAIQRYLAEMPSNYVGKPIG